MSVPVATLIGDVIGSRGVDDRSALHERLGAALDYANEQLSPVRALRISVGDEYQGVFERVGEAVAASLLVRLALAPHNDVRHGIGWGQVSVLDDRSGVEDGPGWWAARTAIEHVHAAQGVPATRRLRTAYYLAPDTGGPSAPAVNAALVLRDETVSGLAPRSLSVLRGLLQGQPQKEIAADLGISASAVSQHIRAAGIGAVEQAHRLLLQA